MTLAAWVTNRESQNIEFSSCRLRLVPDPCEFGADTKAG